jgi:muconate cycloisomerase
MRAESIIIEIKFDNDISGYGESTPRPYVTGETPESVTAVVRDHFSLLLLGREIASVNDIEKILYALEDKCRENNISSYLSALGAVDIALLDGFSKSLEMPLSSLLGPIVREKITYTIPIPLLPIDAIREIPKYLTGIEFSSIKVLMGESVTENMERLELIRSIFGSNTEISIEANGKWTYQQAIDNLNKLKEFNITAVEQPVHSSDLVGLKKIREITGIPVMVDESMCTLDDAKLLISSGACDILNIKISKCGGLLKSKEIADFALSKGVRFQLGTHVGETDILNKAGQNLAVVSPNIIHFEGFSSLLFENVRDGGNLKKGDGGHNSVEAAHSIVNIDNHSLKMIHSVNLESAL